MASASDVDEVRRNTDTSADDDDLTFAVLSGYVDELGIAGASAKVWEQKSAKYVALCDVSEAGAQERLSQLATAALKAAAYWSSKASAEVVAADVTVGRAKTHAMTRSTG